MKLDLQKESTDNLAEGELENGETLDVAIFTTRKFSHFFMSLPLFSTFF
jgi:hypothetical protein